MQILALSSSRVSNLGYMEAALPMIRSFLGESALKIAFIPFASVANSYDDYLSMVKKAFSELPHQINLVDHENPKKILEEADVIMTGGGNTFKLLHDLYKAKILDLIRNKVDGGTPFIGWSAGSNILCPSICTTNDMPIIEPESFNALGLFPFQINAHYFNQKIVGHNGESRDQRLEEFMKINPGISLVCLPEGTALQYKESQLNFIGDKNGVLFSYENNDGEPIRKELTPGNDISYLF